MICRLCGDSRANGLSTYEYNGTPVALCASCNGLLRVRLSDITPVPVSIFTCLVFAANALRPLTISELETILNKYGFDVDTAAIDRALELLGVNTEPGDNGVEIPADELGNLVARAEDDGIKLYTRTPDY